MKNISGYFKIYNTNNNLTFEGEYLNGKAKDYFAGILEFEGEYINGERYGKGKEYNEFGKVLFEGVTYFTKNL